MGLLLALLTLAGTYVSFQAPSEKELLDRFGEAQRFYAEGAYDQAISQYDAVSKVRSRVLDTQSLDVTVGEASYPVQEAALYQVGNANGKLYSDYRNFSESASDDQTREEFATLAEESLTDAEVAFRKVIDTATNTQLRGQAYGRLIELNYEAGKFDRVIETSAQLIEAFGSSPLSKTGYYNTGWAFYETQRYEESIKAFETLLERFPAGFEADRSRFQIGECYLSLERYEKAIDVYRDLVSRQRIDDLTDAELEQIRREKLAGLVDETALELAAKAQIRVGTCYAKLGRYDEGVEAYRTVIDRFATERNLVEEAYLQMARLYDDGGNAEAAVETYREAIRETSDRTLRARIQYALAERLLVRGEYEGSISEFRIYLQAYGDIAAQAGFSQPRVRYRLGSAYQRWAQTALEAAGTGAAQVRLEAAIAHYDTLLVQDPESAYVVDATFNRAVALQAMGTDASLGAAQSSYEGLVAAATDLTYVERSLVQLAELHGKRSDHAAAIAAAQRLLDEFPASDLTNEALLLMGLAHQAQGELELAVGAFARVSSADPALYTRASMGGGHALLSLGRPQEAISTLEAGVGVAEDAYLSSFQYLIGQSHQSLGESEQAFDHFGKGLAAQPPRDLEEALRLARGNAALLTGKLETAIEDLEWVINEVDDPSKVKYARDALAISYLRQNRGADALTVLDEMTRTAQTPEEEAELLSRILDLYYDQDDYAQAAGVAQRLLALEFADGTTAERPFTLREKALYLLGDALLRQENGTGALAAFARLLDEFEGSVFEVPVRLNRATQLFASGELEDAAVAFEVLRERPLDREQSYTVDFYLANTRYSLRQFDEAHRLFADLLVADPNAPERPDLLFGLAESKYQLGEFEQASGHYRTILAEFPNETSADDSQYNLAWCLIELDREDEAMIEFGRILKNYPQSEFAPAAQFTFGDYAYNRQQYSEALTAYRKVQEAYPQATVAAQVPRLIDELKEALAYQEYEKGLELMDLADGGGGEQDYRRAIEVFDQVREAYPGTESEIGAISNMGVCLESIGRWQEAVDLYDEVIVLFEQERATREAYQFAKAHRDWIVSTRL
ncbi:MAG: tetratricopeptide repeat protein [Gemmatimonadetes bacterium]|jgi:tetratricopeptide (TPR) repeat protein|nr:tetratricopeptide repeat protein [Gemmatimonadota bacterium]MBT5142410.1 tetratricopeptide repeat protein [Gemmatimonadota bacterium]MBT5588212.1 tetratricopeptide repeat protein [Gemmatimonadota bacterium]MBT5961063.1 tetratricopeptide repeat protein [Gemmatimonadota bacterium]MBT6626063.1 tetratricopeptide repeat protein [Gemmatimonadota bacterium]